MAEVKGDTQIPSWLIAVVSLLVGGGALYLLLGEGVLAVTPHLLGAAVVWGVIWAVTRKLRRQG